MLHFDTPLLSDFLRPATRRTSSVRPRSPSPTPPPPPSVSASTHKTLYRLSLTPPSGYELAQTHASVEQRKLTLEGTLRPLSQPGRYEYAVRERAAVYDRPSSRLAMPLRLVPRGALMCGGAPSEAGWITLANGGYMLDDGSLQIVRKLRPRSDTPFEKFFELPYDADIESAVSDPAEDGSSWVITVPRIRQDRTHEVRVNHPQARRAEVAPPPVYEMYNKRNENKHRTKRVSPARSEPAEDAGPSTMRPRVLRPPSLSYSTRRCHPSATSSTEPMECDAVPAPAVPLHVPESPSPPAAKRRAESPHPDATKPPCVVGVATSTDPLLSGPVLQETSLSAANVQRPPEVCEEWVAMRNGGFKPLSGRKRRM